MRNAAAVLALSSCLVLTGCMSSLRIKKAPLDLSKPKGLPFYAKVGACKQQTVWLEYRYEISADKFGPVVLNQQGYDTISPLLSKAANGEVLQTIFAKLGLQPVAPFITDNDVSVFSDPNHTHNLILGANTGELIAIVDYSNPMWLNSSRPLAGSTQVSGKFGPDGTLTEASAQLNDQTLSTIVSTITSLAGVATKGLESSAEPFKITIKTSTRAHTHTLYTVLDPNTSSLSMALTKCSAAATPITGGSWVITDPAKQAEDPKKKDTDKPATDKKDGSS